MTTTSTASRVLTAVASGLAITGYYATPDVIASRTARGWAKAGLAAVSLAVEVPRLRAERAAHRAAAAAEDDVPASTERSVGADGALGPDGTAGAGGAEPSPSDASRFRRRLVALGVLAVVSAGSVALTVSYERWLFRRGEARAAAGVRFAHTRTAAVLGALTVALSLIPSPADGEDADGEDAGSAGVRTA